MNSRSVKFLARSLLLTPNMLPSFSLLSLLLLWPATVGLAPAQCPTLETAHERFLASSFTLERHFRFSVNGELKRREVARLAYADGVTDIEILEEEILSKSLVLDGQGDPVIDLAFSCARLEELSDGRFALNSEDEIETATFALDSERNALRPVRWHLITTERFLFKKFEIVGVAEYGDFEWDDEIRR